MNAQVIEDNLFALCSEKITSKSIDFLNYLKSIDFCTTHSYLLVKSLRLGLLKSCEGITSLKLLNDHITSSNVNHCLEFFYGNHFQKLCYYKKYLIKECMDFYTTELISENSFIQILTSGSFKLVELKTLLIGNACRKEKLICTLLTLYERYITEDLDASELAKKYLQVFHALKVVDETGFFLQIFSQKFKEIFIKKLNAIKVILDDILVYTAKLSSTPLEHLFFDNYQHSSWQPDPIEAEYGIYLHDML